MCGVAEALTGVMGLMSIRQNNIQAKNQENQLRAQMDTYYQQANAAEQNAKTNERKGEQIAEQYAQQQQKLNDHRKLVRGQIAAEQGAAGVTGIGSGLDILSASNQQYINDSMNLLQNQRNDTYDNYVQTVNYRNQANSYRASGDNAKSAINSLKSQTRLSNIGTILGTASSIYGMSGTRSADTATGTTAGGYTYTGSDSMPHYSASNRNGFTTLGTYGTKSYFDTSESLGNIWNKRNRKTIWGR